MNYEMILKLKVDELKSYLRSRNLKVCGSKQKLISRRFVAVENNEQVVSTVVENIEENCESAYKQNIVVDPSWMIRRRHRFFGP